MSYINKIIFVFILIFSFGCNNNNSRQDKKEFVQLEKNAKKKILLQPFSDLPPQKANDIFKKLSDIYPNAELLRAIDLPSNAYYKPRNRYRADSIIHWLSDRVSKNQVIAGITSKDISTKKGEIADWGVMGLGVQPGTSCVISTFRLKNSSNEQLFKIVIHELGHNFGLAHCPVITCFMRDAKGGNPTDDEKDFCPSCKKVLRNSGWRI